MYAIIETSVFTALGFITETSVYVLAKINSHFIMKNDLCIYDSEDKIYDSSHPWASDPAFPVNCTFQPMTSECSTHKSYWKYYTQMQN